VQNSPGNLLVIARAQSEAISPREACFFTSPLAVTTNYRRKERMNNLAADSIVNLGPSM
jgi:hypothetical protein